MSSLSTKRWAANLIAGTAMAGASLAFAGPANASVIPVNCPSNGVTLYSYNQGHNCYAGVGSPPSGAVSIHIINPDWISSNWNHGYSNYYYAEWVATCQCSIDVDTGRSYQANGLQYYYDPNAEYAYSVVISS
jgi:hypothetical protein